MTASNSIIITDIISQNTITSNESSGSKLTATDILDLLEADIEDDGVDIVLPPKLISESVQLLNNMKLVFHNKTCTYNQKLKLLSLLPSHWTIETIQEHFDVTIFMIRKARTCLKENGILSSPIGKRGI